MKLEARFKTLAIACALAFSTSASAAFLDTVLTSGANNRFEDNSREAAIDNGDGIFGVGDVVIGFVRIENKSAPASATATFDNNIYAIFSQELVSIAPSGHQVFGATTVAGLRISDIVAGAPANAAVAVYSTASSAVIGDLVLGLPAAGAASMLNDYFSQIKLGSLELVAGFSEVDDFIISDPVFPAGGLTFSETGILGADSGISIAGTTGGLSILQNFTGFDFLEVVNSSNPLAGITQHQLAIVSGTTGGANDVVNFANFGDASGFGGGHQQCFVTGDPTQTNVPCGFADNADFVLHPLARVPEPGTVALLGLGLLGLVGVRRRLGA